MHAAEVQDPYDPSTGWTRPAPSQQKPPKRKRTWADIAFWGIVGVLVAAGLFGLSLVLGLWPEPETTAGNCQTDLDAPRVYVADAGAGETAVQRVSEQLRNRGAVVLGSADATESESGATRILSGPGSQPAANALHQWFPDARTVNDNRDGFVATIALGPKGGTIGSDMSVGPATEACTG
ncbi:LytR C-terminal domain-containing protein [Kytococcus sp. Marseille-QA3725]